MKLVKMKGWFLMTPRIQFRLSDSEYAALLQEAKKQGYPDATPYAKDLVLATLVKSPTSVPSKSFIDLYKEAVGKIKDLPTGTTFVLRDIIPTPPALLGRYVFEAVQNKNIPDVKYLDKDGLATARYEKL